MSARQGQAKARRDCFLAHSWFDATDGRWKVTCYACHEVIDAAETDWIAEHLTMYVLTRDHRTTNVAPSCIPCKIAKDKRDAAEWAKTKRLMKSTTAHAALMAAKAGQIETAPDRDAPRRSGPKMKSRPFPNGSAKIRSAGFAKGSRPLPGTKASGLRRRMSGRVERRDGT